MLKKTIKLVILVFGILTISSCSKDNDVVEKVVVSPAGKMMLSVNNLDFDGVPIDKTSEKEVTITNIGDAPLEIINFYFSDGNESKEFSTTAKATTIAVGKTYTFKITLKPTKKGIKKTSLAIFSKTSVGAVQLSAYSYKLP